MNRRQHALLARELLQACGGAHEAIRAMRDAGVQCRRDTIFDTARADGASYLRVDQLHFLEDYCGKRIYSRAIADCAPAEDQPAGVVEEACETSELAVALQRLVRQAVADGVLTPNEKVEIEQLVGTLERKLRDVRAAADRGRP